MKDYKFAFFFPTSTGKIAWSGETTESLPNRGGNGLFQQYGVKCSGSYVLSHIPNGL